MLKKSIKTIYKDYIFFAFKGCQKRSIKHIFTLCDKTVIKYEEFGFYNSIDKLDETHVVTR